ncbi:MAG: hypothetical protein COB51_09580 [Moraxellaceae bacterium]|nr:MAG: hypothetical protein COB51_09580 [Moraxellaceae bacterium]
MKNIHPTAVGFAGWLCVQDRATSGLTVMTLIIRKNISYLLILMMAMQSMAVMANEHLMHGQQITHESIQQAHKSSVNPIDHHRTKVLLALTWKDSSSAPLAEPFETSSSKDYRKISEHANQSAAEKHCCDCHTLLYSFLLSNEDQLVAEVPHRTGMSEYRFSFLSSLNLPALRPPIRNV